MSFDFVSAEYQWTLPQSEVRSRLEQSLGPATATDDTTIAWVLNHPQGLVNERIALDSSTGSIRLTRSLHHVFKYLILLAGAGTVLRFTTSVEWLDSGVFLLLILLFLIQVDEVGVPSANFASLEVYDVSPYYYMTILLLLVNIGTHPGLLTGFRLGAIIVLVLLFFVGYGQGSLPTTWSAGFTPKTSPPYILIPAAGLAAPVSSMLIILMIAALWGAAPGWIAILGTILVGAFGGSLFGALCDSLYHKLQQSEFAPYESAIAKTALLLVFLTLNVVLFGVAGWAIEIISIAIVGFEILPVVFVSEVTRGMVTLTRESTAWASISLNGVQTNLVAGAVWVFPFMPMVLIVLGWAVHVSRGIQSRWYLLKHSTPLRREGISLSDTATVATLDTEQPIIRAVGLLFGTQQYILVSTSVVDALNDDELAAVLAHENYHIKNRDLFANVLATMTGILAFGGRNALLAFYDYPRIEREADDHASAVVGTDPLIRALYKYDNLTGGLNVELSHLGSPDGPAPQDQDTSSENGLKLFGVSWRVRREIHYYSMVYRLFFGPVLTENSYLPISDRVDRLKQ